MAQQKLQIGDKKLNTIDWTLLLIVMGIVSFGMISLYSATINTRLEAHFLRQITALVIGLCGMFTIAFLPKNLFKYISYPIYIACIALLIYVKFFGIEIAGTKGWLRFGGFSFQPAELAKFAVIMVSAVFLSERWADIKNIRTFLIIFFVTMLPVSLIMLQPDVGTATVIIAIYIGIIFWSGFNPLFIFVFIAVPLLVILGFIGSTQLLIGLIIFSLVTFLFKQKLYWKIGTIGVFIFVSYISPVLFDKLMNHQKTRIETFLDPYADPLGSGYNVIQSIYAVGSGGLTGKGFLQGSQTQLRYIPMQWTDFIYSVPTEEFGFIGGSLVILLFAALIYRIVKIASASESKFHSILSIGTATLFFYHCIINIGMAIGLVPVMGIPLPFMSYGGSFMIMNLMLIGILLHIQRQNVLSRHL